MSGRAGKQVNGQDAPVLSRLGLPEREIVRLVAAGQTNRQIAAELQVDAETAKTLVARAFAKLGTSSHAEAVSVCLQEAFRLALGAVNATSLLAQVERPAGPDDR